MRESGVGELGKEWWLDLMKPSSYVRNGAIAGGAGAVAQFFLQLLIPEINLHSYFVITSHHHACLLSSVG